MKPKALVLLVLILLATALAGLACATPHLQMEDPATLLDGPLAFIADGATTREEVILRLAEPSARFEADRILTYALTVDRDGKWHLAPPPQTPPSAFREWPAGTGSLVLVFGPDGVLVRHSFVVPK